MAHFFSKLRKHIRSRNSVERSDPATGGCGDTADGYVGSRGLLQASPFKWDHHALRKSFDCSLFTTANRKKKDVKREIKEFKTRVRKFVIDANGRGYYGRDVKTLAGLEISEAGLTYVIKEIGLLRSLKVLNISKNNICWLPLTIGRLQNLEVFNASYNDLVYLPFQICNLKKLTYLNLSYNLLRFLPKNFNQLEGLTELDVSFNADLVSLPVGMVTLKKLKVLNLNGTPIGDNILRILKRKARNMESELPEFESSHESLDMPFAVNATTTAMDDDEDGVVFDMTTTAVDVDTHPPSAAPLQLPAALREIPDSCTVIYDHACQVSGADLKRLTVAEDYCEEKALSSSFVDECEALSNLPDDYDTSSLTAGGRAASRRSRAVSRSVTYAFSAAQLQNSQNASQAAARAFRSMNDSAALHEEFQHAFSNAASTSTGANSSRRRPLRGSRTTAAAPPRRTNTLERASNPPPFARRVSSGLRRFVPQLSLDVGADITSLEMVSSVNVGGTTSSASATASGSTGSRQSPMRRFVVRSYTPRTPAVRPLNADGTPSTILGSSLFTLSLASENTVSTPTTATAASATRRTGLRRGITGQCRMESDYDAEALSGSSTPPVEGLESTEPGMELVSRPSKRQCSERFLLGQ